MKKEYFSERNVKIKINKKDIEIFMRESKHLKNEIYHSFVYCCFLFLCYYRKLADSLMYAPHNILDEF